MTNPWIPIVIAGVLYKLTQASPDEKQKLIEENKQLKKRLRENQKKLKNCVKNEEIQEEET